MSTYNDSADLGWRGQAACFGHDPELWFPTVKADSSFPRAICDSCPVKAECLEFAHQTDDTYSEGIMGGLDAWERKNLRRREKRVSPNARPAKARPNGWAHANAAKDATK